MDRALNAPSASKNNPRDVRERIRAVKSVVPHRPVTNTIPRVQLKVTRLDAR